MIESRFKCCFCIGSLIALTSFEIDSLVERNIVDSKDDFLCVFLTKLLETVIAPFDGCDEESRVKLQVYTGEQAKAMTDISGVYFFIKQRERDLGQYQHDNFDEFKRLVKVCYDR